MKAYQALPGGYREIYSVNMQKDKKLAFWLNFFSLVIGAVMAVPMHFYIPISTVFDMSEGTGMYFLRFGAMLVFTALYMVAHELVHGIAMKSFGTKKVKYGFTGLFAYAGSTDYYGKAAYIIIALAPVVVWGIVIGVINAFVPESWFWVVYYLQICNISGAAGDFFVSAKFSRMPWDILVTDCGLGMTVYSRQ